MHAQVWQMSAGEVLAAPWDAAAAGGGASPSGGASRSIPLDIPPPRFVVTLEGHPSSQPLLKPGGP